MSELTTTAGQVAGEIADVIGEKIGALAESLKVPAEHLLEIGKSGMFSEGLVSVAGFLLGVVFMCIALFFGLREQKKENAWRDDANVDIVCTFIFGISGGLIIFCSIVSFFVGDSLVKLTAPEYSLIKMLIN
jgi:hypothetical protein